jgi:hypothetical protein
MISGSSWYSSADTHIYNRNRTVDPHARQPHETDNANEMKRKRRSEKEKEKR